MLDVKYAKLELMRPAVNAAIDSEKTFHQGCTKDPLSNDYKKPSLQSAFLQSNTPC